MSNVVLLFPPGTDPRGPYLALPCLAASLRQAGIDARLYDLDIGGVHALLKPDALRSAGQKVRSSCSRNSDNWRMAARSECLPDAGPEALQTLRDRKKFYNPNEFNSARQTIYDCLDLHSLALGTVHYGISPIRYDIDGIDPQSLDSLIQATDSDQFNLFAAYWEQDVFPELQRQPPLFAGVAINNRQQLLPGLLLARRLRERGHFTVIGGALFTKFSDKLATLPRFFDYFADALVVYEGETALASLTNALASGKSLSEVPNLVYAENGVINKTTTHVEDVTKLPTPDFEGLPLEKYLAPEPVFPVYFGKGCYFNRCKFCDIPYINHISKKAYRLRTIDQIVGDLTLLKRRFGCRHFEITDEALPPRFLENLADALAPHQSQRFRFVGYGRLERGFTAEACRKLYGMGLRKLFFGLESGDQATLDHMDKGIRLADVPQVLRNCRDAGIHFHVFSIIGFPQETERSARETYAFFERNAELLNHPGNSFDIHPFGLEMRTSYFAESRQMGVLISPAALTKDFVVGLGTQWFNTFGLTHAEVERLVAVFNDSLKRLFARYHAAPEHLWPAFEEYSVLYSDYYEQQPFDFRTNLPDQPDLESCLLRLPPTLAADLVGSQVRVGSRKSQMEWDSLTYETLRLASGRSARETITQLAHQSSRPIDEMREVVNDWMTVGLLQMEPHQQYALAGVTR